MTPFAKRRILLVDDDATVVQTVGDRLRFEGFDVVQAFSAEEGLRACSRQVMDLIILDIGMPGMTGLTFLDQIGRREKRKPPILVFTARAHIVDDIQKTNGVDAVLVKTVDPGELLASVRRLLAGPTEGDGQ